MHSDDMYPYQKLWKTCLLSDIHDFCVKNILHIVQKYLINEFMHFLLTIIYEVGCNTKSIFLVSLTTARK